MKRIKFRYNENEYTLRVMADDWELEDGPSDMSERMMDKCKEVAIENGMFPPKDECIICAVGRYETTRADYLIAGVTIKGLMVRICNVCSHMILPWKSVVRVDAAIEADKKAVGSQQ